MITLITFKDYVLLLTDEAELLKVRDAFFKSICQQHAVIHQEQKHFPGPRKFDILEIQRFFSPPNLPARGPLSGPRAAAKSNLGLEPIMLLFFL